MVAVITGDIIGSQKTNPKLWLKLLKKELGQIGENPKTWELYRGDSFQAIVSNPAEALQIAIKLKATLKTIPEIDVRIAIGIGRKTFTASRVTESNGTAFVHSGETIERLKNEKQTMAIKSDWPDFDKEMNLMLKLSLIIMDNWTINAAEVVRATMENPETVQHKLGKLVGIKQSAVSNRLKRAYFDEIMEVNDLYKEKLKTLQ